MDWGSPGGETGGREDFPPNEQLLQFGEAWTLEKPTSCRAGRISCNAGRLAPPAPLFAAAILLGAAAAVAVACPSSSRGPGLSAGRRDPSASVCLHVPTVPALVWRTPPVGFPKQPGKITNRDLAPKKRKALPARGRLDPWGRGRGLSKGGVLRLCVRLPLLALQQGAGS